MLASGWQLQDVAKVPQPGAEVASRSSRRQAGTRLPFPGLFLRRWSITMFILSLCMGRITGRRRFLKAWRAPLTGTEPCSRFQRLYSGKHIWLNFDGINYSATVWVNGSQVGTMRGAFARGTFDISANVKAGKKAVVAVLVSPQPHPGVPHEHTLRDGMGLNGGITAIDGPTFLSTIGWDWIPAIRDRDTGIWQKVFLSATGPVVVKESAGNDRLAAAEDGLCRHCRSDDGRKHY